MKGVRIIAGPAGQFGIYPVMIHAWKKLAPLESVSGVFERGGWNTPEMGEEQVEELHVKIGERAVANDFLARKLKPCCVK
ncbi:hypothetical protein ACS3SW_17570 [Roseobacteraceae bacterium S113]